MRITGFGARLLPSIILSALLLAMASPSLGARLALIIGNRHYIHLDELAAPGSDAAGYAKLFTDKHFDQVILKHDLSLLDMDQALAAFVATIQPGDTAVFVFSGQGWDDGSTAYVTGVDAPVSASASLLRRISVPLVNGTDGIIERMAHRSARSVAIVDVGRESPFPSGATAAVPSPLPPNSFVMLSTGAGQKAFDALSLDDSSDESVFTRVYLPLLRSGETLLDAARAAQPRVANLAATIGGKQQPAYADSLLDDGCLFDQCGP